MKTNITKNLKNKIGNEIMNLDVLNQVPGSAIEAMKDMNAYNRELGEDETKEATSSGAAGQFSQPLFSTTKKEMEEKWSKKYKDSIDCNNPKGFSQRAHCQSKKKKLKEQESIQGGLASGRTLKDIAKMHSDGDETKMYKHLEGQLKQGIKVEMEHTNEILTAKEIALDHLYEDPDYYTKLEKIEATEATSTSSAGQYSTPAFVAKNSKNWRGGKKPLYPGGKFVKIKDKCKKFPYCNQGDIKALKLFENKMIKKSINSLSKKYGVSESMIKSILVHEFENYNFSNKLNN
jgi:hypothetical protein